MNYTSFTERENVTIVQNIKFIADSYHTSKSDIAKILEVSERTVNNRFSGNVKTSFTIVELLKLCRFWGISLKELISPRPMNVNDILSDLETEHTQIMNLLKKQIKMKGETL